MRIRDYKSYQIRGMVYDHSDINKIKMHPSESYAHFMAKAALFHKLRRLHHDVLTEVVVQGLGVGDLVDLTRQIQYELEFSHKCIRDSKINKYWRKDYDIIVINCTKMPPHIKDISKFLEDYIVVD